MKIIFHGLGKDFGVEVPNDAELVEVQFKPLCYIGGELVGLELHSVSFDDCNELPLREAIKTWTLK
jgi:hypothetical protein